MYNGNKKIINDILFLKRSFPFSFSDSSLFNSSLKIITGFGLTSFFGKYWLTRYNPWEACILLGSNSFTFKKSDLANFPLSIFSYCKAILEINLKFINKNTSS